MPEKAAAIKPACVVLRSRSDAGDPSRANRVGAVAWIARTSRATTECYTSRLCSTAAAMKLLNRGCGANGRLFSSGWNCTPTNQG